MITVHSTHGLFLTYTQESCLYLHSVQLVDIYTVYKKSLIEPPAKVQNNPNLLGRPVSCSWWRIPIHSGPLPGCNCPTLWLLPLSPLSHSVNPHDTTYNDDINNHGLLCPGQYLSFSGLSVIAVLSRLSCHCWPDIAILAELSCHGSNIMSLLSWLSCPCHPVKVIRSRRPSNGYPVTVFWSWLSGVQSMLSSPRCPVGPWLPFYSTSCPMHVQNHPGCS
jgi:hypothetical protein